MQTNFMIKKYEQFIKESSMSELEELADQISEVTDHFGSYSNRAIDSSYDYESDLKKIYDDLEDIGVTKGGIELLYDHYGDDFIDFFMNRPDNAGYDILLHDIIGEIPLSGYRLEEVDFDGNESIIKYSYGYHNTSYGMKFLEQNFPGDTVNKWLNHCAKRILDNSLFSDGYFSEKYNIKNSNLVDVMPDAIKVIGNVLSIDVSEFNDKSGNFIKNVNDDGSVDLKIGNSSSLTNVMPLDYVKDSISKIESVDIDEKDSIITITLH